MAEALETETLYSPAAVADALGVSPPQVRRWAAALESVTGQPIKQHPRTGRAYTQQQLDVLVQAKRIASAASGMSAETALSIALGQTGLSVPLKSAAEPTELSRAVFNPEMAEALAQAIAEAQTKAQQPLIDQLQALTVQLERLEQSSLPAQPSDHLREPETLGGTEQSPKPAERRSGALVRAAERIEGWLTKVFRRMD